MKKKFSVISLMGTLLLTVGMFISNVTNASCVSCDTFPDDGKCNRPAIGSKRCIYTIGFEGDDCQRFYSAKEECPIIN